MVVVVPMRNLPKFYGEKTELAGNNFDAFDHDPEMQQSNAAEPM